MLLTAENPDLTLQDAKWKVHGHFQYRHHYNYGTHFPLR